MSTPNAPNALLSNICDAIELPNNNDPTTTPTIIKVNAMQA